MGKRLDSSKWGTVTKDLLVNRVVLVCHKTTGASGSGGSLSY